MFRRLQFGAKAGLITLAFLVPLVVLAVAYVAKSHATLAQAQREWQGLDALQAIEPWMVEAQKQRRLVLSGMAAEVDLTAIDSAREAFGKAAAALPAAIDLKAATEAVAQAQQALRQGGLGAASPDFQARMQRLVDSIASLRGDLLDKSGLTLDPDQDTHYLIVVASDAASDVIEAVSRSRAMSGGLRDDAPPQALRPLYGVWNQGQVRMADLMRAAERAGHANGAVQDRLDAARAGRASDAFFAAAARSWFGTDFHADVQALNPSGQAAVDELRGVATRGTALLRELLQQRIAATEQARNLVSAVGIVCLAVAAYLFYSFYLVMTGGLREVSRHLAAMTHGDLTTHPQPWGQDESAQLMVMLAEMQHSLRGMVAKVRVASHGIVTASSEIAAGSGDLSARTEQAAASLEESAAAMEQIGATVRQNASDTREATDMASRNAALAVRGGTVMGEVVATMQAIQDASKRIGDIIGVIDAIAFQTNILALNAAVEAARAGEQGRGFAVVASEVRALAGRTTTAAREVKSLIVTSVERVEKGTGVVQEAGGAIQEIVVGAERINQLLSQIAAGAREQTDGIGHVGTAVQELDQATQQNASMVEQTAAAASSLLDQANGLAAEVERFRLP